MVKKVLLFVLFFSPAFSYNININEINNPSEYIEKEIYLTPRKLEKKDIEKIFIDRVYFQFDSTHLKRSSYIRLKEIVFALNESLKKNDHLQVYIAGYADKTGGNEYNLRLGLRRAEYLSHLLVENGLMSNKIKIASFGENKSYSMKANARAAEIFLTSGKTIRSPSSDMDADLLSIIVGLFIILIFALFILYFAYYTPRKNR